MIPLFVPRGKKWQAQEQRKVDAQHFDVEVGGDVSVSVKNPKSIIKTYRISVDLSLTEGVSSPGKNQVIVLNANEH